MSRKQKLELTWIGKETRPKLEPRILLEDPEKSYHAAHRVTDDDIFDNRLIYGDNLLALKALEQEFIGKIRCVYIDPPYNTGSAFEHYDDGVEHSLWLSLMRNRLELLRSLLTEDGSLWVQLDDNEVYYCKVMLDEIFGRPNFVSSVVWQKVFAKKNKALISGSHDILLVYAKDISKWKRNLLTRNDEQAKAFKNPDNDPRGAWQSVAYSVQSEDSERRSAYRYSIPKPAGGDATPPPGRHWNGLPDRTHSLIADNRLWFGPKGDRTPRIKVFLNEVQTGIVPDSWWEHEDFGNNQEAKKEQLALFPESEPFNTPKPERLIRRIIEIATNPGDWVLDSFAGSGTTGAVAHKMGRRWVMVELENTCHSHVIPRLQQVVDGKDYGGVTGAVGWNGGGGFRYYTLAPSLLQEDEFGNWIINKKYNPEMLAEALCKLEGFTYAPSTDFYWQHGHSTETDFIYVTTQTLTREQLQKLSDEVGTKRSLLICCAAFRVKKLEDFPNLTLKKIPLAVMSKCEWGKDDYSLAIKALPDAPEPESDEFAEVVQDLPKNKRKARKVLDQQASLFASEDAE